MKTNKGKLLTMKNERYYNFCVKFITGEISAVEQTELETWLIASAENRDFYEHILATWNKTEIDTAPGNLPIDAQWEQLSERLGFSEGVQGRERVASSIGMSEKLKWFFQPRFRPAYALVGVFAIVLILLFSLREPKISPLQMEISTTNGETTEYTFSDGSHVRLNSGSSIQFFNIFSDTLREVYLKGEGFFSIAKENRPFIVNTENAKTTVLGTEFNVWSRGSKTRVVVKSGKVRFSSSVGSESIVVLAQNQMSCIAEQSAPTNPATVDANYLLGWLHGRLVFERRPMLEIIDEIERTYDISVLIENIDLEGKTITASFDSSSIETIFASLCLTLDIHYKIDRGQVTLF